MRRVLAVAAVIGIVVTVSAPVTAAAAGAPVVRSYTSVTCFVDWSDPVFRNAGLGGQTEHDSAVITNELWVYDAAGGWRMAGTEVDTVQVETNYRTGVELFRGSFVVDGALGAFAGTFMWTENPSGARGHGDGRATDGSGLLWKSTAGVIDPAASGVPPCAAEREVYALTRLDLVMP